MVLSGTEEKVDAHAGRLDTCEDEILQLKNGIEEEEEN